MTTPSRNVLSLKRSAPEQVSATLEERLHKVLATAGLGSRRMLESRIEAGEVLVNGNDFRVVRQRETVRHLRSGEKECP